MSLDFEEKVMNEFLAKLNGLMALIGYLATLFFIVRVFMRKSEVYGAFTLSPSPEGKKKLNELQRLAGGCELKEVLRRALLMYEKLSFWRRDNQGGVMFLRYPDGQESEFEFE